MSNFTSKINQIRKTLNDVLTNATDEEMLEVMELISAAQIKIINGTIKNSKIKLVKPNKGKTKRCEVAPNVYINAYPIDDESEVHNHRGYMCYHKDKDVFMYSINNHVIPVYVTNMNKQPYKFIEYDKGKSANGENFYKPPELYGGNDKRQLTDRITYIPSSENSHNNKYAIRVGDRDNLAEDISRLSASDMRLAMDNGSHWNMIHIMLSIAQKGRRKEKATRRK